MDEMRKNSIVAKKAAMSILPRRRDVGTSLHVILERRFI
jgi:hypothetical protein